MAAKLDTRVIHSLSYGLYIVTSQDNDRRNGQLINTAIQVTSKPDRVAVINNKKNFTPELITNSGIFTVSVLEEATPSLLSAFSVSDQGETSTNLPKFNSKPV